MWVWLTDCEFLRSSTDKRTNLNAKASRPRSGADSLFWRLNVSPGEPPRSFRAFSLHGPLPGGSQKTSSRLANRDLQGPDAVNSALDLVARRERGDTGWRPRHDDIAGAERNLLGELGDNLWHAPDQFGEVALLAFSAVYREPDFPFDRVADLRRRLQRAAWRGMVEGFADLPRPLFLARSQLQVPTGEVDTDAVTVDVFERVIGRNIKAATLHRHDQFDFVVQVLGQRRVGDGGAIRFQHIGVLREEERRRTFVISHLADVLEI